jgi:hypothetical protein
MYADRIQISNKNLRYTQIFGNSIVFAYEDGRTVTVTFTSARRANRFFEHNNFVTPEETPTAFHLDGIEGVSYDAA